VKEVQRLARPDFTIRIDANQGCTLTEAEALLAAMDPAIVEHFEQPFPPDWWEETTALARKGTIPLLLDESIRDRNDLERAIQTGCASAVKFKLMRAGGFRALAELISLAREAGLTVILGNGVATDLGCLQEARLAISMGLTDRAGEMNGFLKASRSILTEPLRVERGALRLPPQAAESLDLREIPAFVVESRRWGAGIG
jgi:L-alanine-DL-glutamate epimerase-like enolase superfamily enzyme